MKVLVAVVQDLWSFAVEALFGKRTRQLALIPRHAMPAPSVVVPPISPSRLALAAAVESALATRVAAPVRPDLPARRPAPPPSLPVDSVALPENLVRKNTIVYVSAKRALFRLSPSQGADNVLTRIPYGMMVMAIEANDEWVRAFYRGKEGWIASGEVAAKAAVVYPHLTVGLPNFASDENTRRVREVIDDEFCYGERELSLAGEEYAFYKLMRRGVSVVWPDARPRTPGNWAAIFREDSGQVTESMEPVERSVMEWRHGTGAGHLAYVEAVHDDGSIRISEADWPRDGVYSERVLLKDEWQKLSPVFLVFG